MPAREAEERKMHKCVLNSALIMTAALIFPCVSSAQYGTGKASPSRAKGAEAAKTGAAPAPAPVHDLSGIWMMRNPPGSNRQFTLATFTDPKTDPPVLTAWGEAKFKEARDSNGNNFTLDQTNDPVLTKCYPPGTPRVYFHPYPFEFMQGPKFMLMVFEYDHTLRRIYTDGRPLPEDPDPSWMGYSVGHWEGDTTFVVETVGFNEKTWLDRLGHQHSDQLHVTERFRRVDADHLQLDITMTDPTALAKPWSTTFYYENHPNWELGEISCAGDYLDFNKSFESFSFKNKDQAPK
jgi:hypothetical protein